MQVGDKQPRTFAVNDNIIVRDLRPNATDRWRKSIVTKILGLLNYEVSVDGHSHQAYVDHLLPATSTLDVGNPTPDNEQADQEHDKQDESTTTNNEVVPFVPLEVESNSLNDSHGQELVTLRPTRNRHPPARLIEEMN